MCELPRRVKDAIALGRLILFFFLNIRWVIYFWINIVNIVKKKEVINPITVTSLILSE